MGLYEKEKDFLKDFFVSYAKYKKLLSADAYEKLYARYSRTVRDDRVRTKLNNKLINVLYFYRKADEENLAKCKALCKKDVELNFDKIDVRDCRLPALKRLILIEALRLPETFSTKRTRALRRAAKSWRRSSKNNAAEKKNKEKNLRTKP